MILTVTPNVAVDRTYEIGRVERGAVHKVDHVFVQTGGKGVNVSRTVAALGRPTVATGIFSGDGCAAAERDLRGAGVVADLYPVGGAPRQTVTLLEHDGTGTAFDEVGSEVTALEWEGFERHVAGLLPRARCMVVAGSLPPGTPGDGLGGVLTAARDHGVRAMVDGRAEPLRAALRHEPLVVKLNRSELAGTVGQACDTDDEVIRAAQMLRALGAHDVIVTLGAGGAIGLCGADVWRVTHPAETGNPIGAGDAFTAGVAVALSEGLSFPDALCEGAAAALACLRQPTAGHVDVTDVEAARPLVTTSLISKGD